MKSENGHGAPENLKRTMPNHSPLTSFKLQTVGKNSIKIQQRNFSPIVFLFKTKH